MKKTNNILSIDFDDDSKNLNEFEKHLKDDTKRKKDAFLFEIETMGNEYLEEIKHKKNIQNINKEKYIKYILKKCDGFYSNEKLLSYSLNDVIDIYNELKDKNTPVFVKFIKFIFNIK